MQLALAMPGKQEFDELLNHFDGLIARTGVTLRLRTRPDDAMLADFDVVVHASGVVPRRLDFPGLDHPSVATYADILSGRVAAERTG